MTVFEIGQDLLADAARLQGDAQAATGGERRARDAAAAGMMARFMGKPPRGEPEPTLWRGVFQSIAGLSPRLLDPSSPRCCGAPGAFHVSGLPRNTPARPRGGDQAWQRAAAGQPPHSEGVGRPRDVAADQPPPHAAARETGDADVVGQRDLRPELDVGQAGLAWVKSLRTGGKVTRTRGLGKLTRAIGALNSVARIRPSDPVMEAY